MKVKLLGAHNCESRDTRLTSLLIDNIIAIDAGSITASLTFEEQKKLKALIITHGHFDHIKDAATLVFNFAMWSAEFDIYSTHDVYEILNTCILNGRVYSKFIDWPKDKPRIRFNLLEPLKTRQIEGYSVLPVSVHHGVPTIGCQIADPEGRTLFYTGDTGPGLAEIWELVHPQLLIIEASATNRYKEMYEKRGHLVPSLLKQELASFRDVKGYLPQIVVIHLNPRLEEETRAELDVVAKELSHTIIVGYEGMELDL